MEENPDNIKHTKRIRRMFAVGFLLLSLMSGAFMMTAPHARALFGVGDVSITVGDVPRIIWTTIRGHLSSAFSIAWRRSLHAYLSKLAFRSATLIASGDRGQGPLFRVGTLTDEFLEAGEAAAVDALDAIFDEKFKFCEGGLHDGKSCTTDKECQQITADIARVDPDFAKEAQKARCSGGLSIDICNIPDPKIKLKIHASVQKVAINEPEQPRCSLEDIGKQIEDITERFKDPNDRLSFVQVNNTLLSDSIRTGKFEDIFNPEANNLGQYFSVLSAVEQEKAKAEMEVEDARKREIGPITTTITGKVKTPGVFIQAQFKDAVSKSDITETTEPKQIIYAAISTFTSTLQSKLLEQFVKGMNPEADLPGSGGGASRFSGLLWSGSSRGKAAAQAKFASLAKSTFGGGGALDVLSQFTVCPSGDHGPTDCVLEADGGWAQVIQDENRLQQAVEARADLLSQYIGYGPNGEDLALSEGLPIRSLKVLRRYRVIPVTWELAAEYAKQYDGGGKTLQQLTSAFEDEDSPYYQMIDPNWVLKVPDSECRRTGYGEVLDFDDYQDDDGNTDTPSPRLIQRRADQCVDDQSCLSVNDDGTCKGAYGYCTKEKPIWRFEGQQCEEYYASCQTLTQTGGGAVSYLLNTVEKKGCGPNNYGCQWYCKDYDDENDRFQCYYDDELEGYTYTPATPLGTDQLSYLDAGTRSCSESAEGCRAFFPLGGGTNLIPNGNFTFTNEDGDEFLGWGNMPPDQYQVLDAEEDPDAYDFVSDLPRAIQLNKDPNPDFIEYALDLSYGANKGYDLAERVFVLSFNGRTTDGSASCNGFAKLVEQASDNGAKSGIVYTDQYQRFTLKQYFDKIFTDDTLLVQLSASSDCDVAIDQVQLEEVHALDAIDPVTAKIDADLETITATTFANYGARNITRLNGERLACTQKDVGCELYSPVSESGIDIPGVAKPGDVCKEDQVGCKLYEEKAYPTAFGIPDITHSSRTGDYVNVISDKAEKCSAQYVGCEEYTNLRKQQEGGEALEYYTFVKQCVLPGRSDIRTYYTLESGDFPGYQARSHELLKSNNGNAPCTSLTIADDPDNLLCNDNGGTNCDPLADGPECIEYYYVDPSSGSVDSFFRMRPRTITASESCTALRNTVDQFIYYGDPNLSTSCPASANSCREYVGNSGYNTRQILFDDFEGGSANGWSDFLYRNVSLGLDGHSISTDEGETETRKAVDIESGGAYMVSFWAKGFGNIAVMFDGASDDDDYFAKSGGGVGGGEANLNSHAREWQFYRFGPVQYDWLGTNELVFTDFLDPGAGDDISYLDNITLTEVSDSEFLTRNSVQGAAACKEVGCTKYESELGKEVNLKSFSRLCKEEFVGCEAMIDSQNTVSNPFAETFGEGATEIGINQDLDPQNQDPIKPSTVQFIVADADKLCQADEQGCTALGLPNLTVEKKGSDYVDILEDYQTVFLRDDPDMYTEERGGIWCNQDELQCAEYSDGVSKYYFKDPRTRTCEYKHPENSLAFNWYITGTDELCPTESLTGNAPGQPKPYETEGNVVTGFVGLCPQEKNGCTEYRDPKDPEPTCLAGCPLKLDGSGKSISVNKNCIVPKDPGDPEYDPEIDLPVIAPGCQPYYYLDSTISPAGGDVVDDDQGLKLFYDTSDSIDNAQYAADISPDGASTGYCSDDHSIDCVPGDPESGDPKCESKDAGTCMPVEDIGTPVLCKDEVKEDNQAACDSNVVLNVRPDRECAEWLSCKTSVVTEDPEDYDNDGSKVEETCLELQKCRTLDPETGRCTDPIVAEDPPLPRGLPKKDHAIGLMSGYVNAGYTFPRPDPYPDVVFDGKYHFQNMIQRGLGTALNPEELVPKWNFEPIAAVTGQPFLKCLSGTRKGKNCMEDEHCPNADETLSPNSCTNDLGEWTVLDANDSISVEEEDRNELTDANNILRVNVDGKGDNGAQVDLGDVIFTGQEYAVSLKAYLDKFSPPVPKIEVSFEFSSGGRESIGIFTPSSEKLDEIVLLPAVISSLDTKGAKLRFDIVQRNEIGGDLVVGKGSTVWFDDVSLKPVLEVSKPVISVNTAGLRADYFDLDWEATGEPGLTGVYKSNNENLKDRLDESIDFYEGPVKSMGNLTGFVPDTPKPLTVDPLFSSEAYPKGGADPFTILNENAMYAEWNGGFHVERSGTLTFLINTNDGFSFYLDDTSIPIFSGVGGIPTRGFSATRYFKRGWHPVRLLWDNKGEAEGGIQLGTVEGDTTYNDAICVPEEWNCPSECIDGVCSADGKMTKVGESDKERWHGISQNNIVPKDNLNTNLTPGFGDLLAIQIESNIQNDPFDARLLDVTGQDDRVIVRWTGKVRFTEIGMYQFRAQSNDGVRLFIDNSGVVPDGYGDVNAHWTDGEKSGEESPKWIVDSPSPGFRDFRLEYYENLGNAKISLQWKPPGAQEFLPIPDEAFSLPEAESGFAARSCRAYPRQDALSCDVIEDNAVRYKGWKGYCVERDPTNQDQCITWYPIDVLRGESIQAISNDQVGYSDRVPLYYCLGSIGNRSPASSVTRTYSQREYAAYQVDHDNLTDDEREIYFCGALIRDISDATQKQACKDRICDATGMASITFEDGGSQTYDCPDGASKDFGTRRFPVVKNDPDISRQLKLKSINPQRFGATPQVSFIQGRNGKTQNPFNYTADNFNSSGCWMSNYQINTLADCRGDINGKNPNTGAMTDYTFAVCNEAEEPYRWGSVNIYSQDSDAGDPNADLVYSTALDGGYLSEDDIEGFEITPVGAANSEECQGWPELTITRDLFGKTVQDLGKNNEPINYSLSRQVRRDLPAGWGDGNNDTLDEIHWILRPSSVQVADANEPADPWENADLDDNNELVNGLWFRAVFNANRQLIRYDFKGDAEVGTSIYKDAGYFTVKVLLRESCKEVVKVADLSGAKSWASRVAPKSDYLVQGEYYDPQDPDKYGSVYYSYGDEETAPFGAAITEEGSPENWDSKTTEIFRQPLFVESKEEGGDQIRAGSPYGCYGYCNYGTCARDHTKSCVTSSECAKDGVPDTCIGKTGVCELDRTIACSWGKFSVNICEDAGAGSRCLGSTYHASSYGSYKNRDAGFEEYGWSRVEEFAVQKLQSLFVSHMGVWQWDYKENKYVRRMSSDDWTSEYQNMSLCTGQARPSEVRENNGNLSLKNPPYDYCGIYPTVGNVLVNMQSGDVELAEGGGEVELKFTSSVDADQLPLKTIVIEWGDGAVFTIPWNQKAKSDPANPHIFRHTYLAGKGLNGCSNDPKSCSWEPKIMVVDNWEFCNDPTASLPGSGGRFAKCALPNTDYLFSQNDNPITITAGY